ncbi:MAG: leucine-rich repeat domain-containing protein [bacterium]
MKNKTVYYLVVLSFVFFSCDSSVNEPEAPCDAVAAFADPVLEHYIRVKVRKTDGRNVCMSDCAKIQSLIIEGTEGAQAIEKLDGIEALTGLKTLVIRHSRVAKLDPLEELTGLTHIDFSHNYISNIEPLEDLTSLVYLDLQKNRIKDTAPVSGLTNLNYLNLSSNSLNDVDDLANLVNLEILYFAGNNYWGDDSPYGTPPPLDLSPIAGLTNLKELQLSANTIEDIGAIAGFLDLEIINLAVNEIVDISPLGGLPNLVHVNLKENEITNIDPLVNNSGLDEGDEVYLCAEDSENDQQPRGIGNSAELDQDHPGIITLRSRDVIVGAYNTAEGTSPCEVR